MFNLEKSLQKKGVTYKEISVQLNIELKSAVQLLAEKLLEKRENFIEQRLHQIIAHNSRASFVIDQQGTR